MFSKETILYEHITAHDHYQVVDMTYEGRKARVLFSGGRKAAFSGMPLDDQGDLLFDYIQRLFELIATQRPKKLLLIGGGTYTLPTALLQALPDILIDTVEIDPELDTIAEAFFNLQDSDRLTIIHDDGKHFLESNSTRYDAIIIDAFSGLKIPKSLADTKTASLLKKSLTKDGLVALNIISSTRGGHATPAKHFMKEFGEAFSTITTYPADSLQSAWSPQNLIMVFEDNPTTEHHGLRFGSVDIV